MNLCLVLFAPCHYRPHRAEMNNLNGRLIKPKAIFIANSEIGAHNCIFTWIILEIFHFSSFLHTFTSEGKDSWGLSSIRRMCQPLIKLEKKIVLAVNDTIDHKSLRKMNRWMILEIVLGDSTQPCRNGSRNQNISLFGKYKLLLKQSVLLFHNLTLNLLPQ